MSSRPNFFIIGAQKSGTSWLADVLSQHDDVFLASEEIHYFDKLHNMKHGFDWYSRHFAGAGSCRAIGEKTPDYLWAHGNGGEGHNSNVHVDITTEFPDAKYLVVVRNPVDRAISALVHTIKTNRVSFLRPIDRLFEDQYRDILK